MNFKWDEATHFAYKWNTVAIIIFVLYVPVILLLNKILSIKLFLKKGNIIIPI